MRNKYWATLSYFWRMVGAVPSEESDNPIREYFPAYRVMYTRF